MKNRMPIIALSALSIAAFGDGYDYVQCKRNAPNFKQFCYIDESTFGNYIEIESERNINGNIIGLSDTLNTRSVQFTSSFGTTTVPLNGLIPSVNVSFTWSDDASCNSSTLWNDNVELHMVDPINNSSRVVGKAYTGPNYKNINATSLQAPDFNSITYSENGSKIGMETTFRFFNRSHTPGTPYPYGRIPLSCGLSVSSVNIAYPVNQLSADLTAMRAQAYSYIETKTAATVVHRSFVDTTEFAGKCAIYDLAENLMAVENALFSYDWLSDTSKTMISNAVQKGSDLGLILIADLPEDDLFQYVMQPDFKSTSEANCIPTTPDSPTPNYTPNREHFVKTVIIDGIEQEVVLNPEGVLNFERYQRAKENLLSASTAAFAISEVSKSIIADYSEPDWLSSGPVLDNN